MVKEDYINQESNIGNFLYEEVVESIKNYEIDYCFSLYQLKKIEEMCKRNGYSFGYYFVYNDRTTEKEIESIELVPIKLMKNKKICNRNPSVFFTFNCLNPPHDLEFKYIGFNKYGAGTVYSYDIIKEHNDVALLSQQALDNKIKKEKKIELKKILSDSENKKTKEKNKKIVSLKNNFSFNCSFLETD